MKSFLRITFAFLALALSATAYCSTTINDCKAEQACIVVSPPLAQLAQEPVVVDVGNSVAYVTSVPFVTFESLCGIVSTLNLCQTYQTVRKAILYPRADIYLNSQRCVMCRRCELTASIGYRERVKYLPNSRHVYTRS